MAAVAVVLLLGDGDGDDYEVTAEFENASQLVGDEQVTVGGLGVGGVKSIELGDDGSALVTFTVSEDYAPLKRGTVATIRSQSLASIASRQVQLTLPADERAGEEIPSGGTMSRAETVSEVDLDQLFNTLDPDTIEDFKRVIQGLEISYDGVGEQANRGFEYLNPFLSTSRRLFGELNRDQRALERLLVDTSRLSGALAARAPDVSALVSNLDAMMNAIGSRSSELSEGVSRLPQFMREANTTFVNLRAALDDLDPLVEAARPAARELGPFLTELREAAADAVPTVRDLDRIVKREGSANDLVELTRLQVPLAKAAIGSGSPDCGGGDLSDPANGAGDGDFDQGAFGESTCALRNSEPTLAMFRPYTPELVGWFDDFSHPATFDANGGIGRIGTILNQFTVSTPPLPGLPGVDLTQPVTDLVGAGLVQTNLDQRCPGTNDWPLPDAFGDDSVPFTDGGALPCEPNDVTEGP